MKMHSGALGIVTGLASEARLVERVGRRAGQPSPLRVCCAGADPARAERLAHELLDGGVHAVVSIGLCGGLDPELEPGSLVVPHWTEVGGDRVASDPSWARRLGRGCDRAGRAFCEGGLVSADAPIATAAEKASLRARSGAVAVDMETSAVARAATARGVAWAALRAVADPASRPLPRAAFIATDPRGRVRLRPLALHVAKHPRELASLAVLGTDAARGMRALQEALAECVAALGRME